MEDYKLVALAKAGDKAAFQALIERYYPYVARYLLKLCRDGHLTEDLTQETFLKLIRHIEKYREGGASFATWLMAVARNTWIDHLRRERPALDIEEIDVPQTHGFEEDVLNKIAAGEMAEAMNNLPPEQAEAIRMKYIGDMTLAEIAAETHCEPGTVKSRIHNGTVKLRLLFKQKGMIIMDDARGLLLRLDAELDQKCGELREKRHEKALGRLLMLFSLLFLIVPVALVLLDIPFIAAVLPAVLAMGAVTLLLSPIITHRRTGEMNP